MFDMYFCWMILFLFLLHCSSQNDDDHTVTAATVVFAKEGMPICVNVVEI